jgi:hypothetical protein
VTIVSLILGVLACFEIGGSRGRVRGLGLAVAGIVVSAADLLVFVSVVMPALAYLDDIPLCSFWVVIAAAAGVVLGVVHYKRIGRTRGEAEADAAVQE